MIPAHLQGKRIYRDDLALLSPGMRILARRCGWTVVDRPTDTNADSSVADPSLITLESLGLGRLRPVPPSEPETAPSEPETAPSEPETARSKPDTAKEQWAARSKPDTAKVP
jgi:hypothetical protein